MTERPGGEIESNVHEILGHKVEIDIAPGDLVLDLIVLARIHSAGDDQGGILIGTSDGIDATVITGLLRRATRIDDHSEFGD